jgi:hypothetical protein
VQESGEQRDALQFGNEPRTLSGEQRERDSNRIRTAYPFGVSFSSQESIFSLFAERHVADAPKIQREGGHASRVVAYELDDPVIVVVAKAWDELIAERGVQSLPAAIVDLQMQQTVANGESVSGEQLSFR